MKKLTAALIALTAIGVAVKVVKDDKKNSSLLKIEPGFVIIRSKKINVL